MSKDHTNQLPEFPDDLWDLPEGTHLNPPRSFGPFLLDELIRVSRMSLLFKGTRASNSEAVALKVCQRSADKLRFDREIRNTQRTTFKGLIEIKPEDVGSAQGGFKYYATRWVDGPTLGQFLQDTDVSLDEKISMVRELCWVVSVLHKQNITHRDLKPSNVVIESGKHPVLLDLGLAHSAELTDMTRTGEHVGGTDGYIPPWSEEDPKLVKHHKKQWDVYSLGVILVEALTGERSEGVHDPDFKPEGVVELFANQPAEVLRYLPTVQSCLAENPDQCFADADALLDQFKLNESAPPVELSASSTHPNPNPFLRWAMFLGLLAVCAVGAFALFFDQHQPIETGQGGDTNIVDIADIKRPPEIITGISDTNIVLHLNIQPVGATVRVIDHNRNGKLVVPDQEVPQSGELKLEIPLFDDPDYSLVVWKERYQPNTQSISSESGSITVTLDRLRGEVEFTTNPSAMIQLNGDEGQERSAGPVPSGGKLLVRSLDEGDWDYKITLANHASETGHIEGLEQGKLQKREAMLASLPGRLSLTGHRLITLWTGVDEIGKANDWITMEAGAYTIEVRRPGFRSETMQVTILPNQDTALIAPELVAEAGHLRLLLEVPLAAQSFLAKTSKQVWLDDKPLVVSDFPHLAKDLGVGVHSIRIEVDGFEPVARQGVLVKDGETTPLTVDLKSLPASLRVRSVPPQVDVYDANGIKIGSSEETISLPSFKNINLSFRASGFKERTQQLDPMEPNRSYQHSVELERIQEPQSATRDHPWENSLGMPFVPVLGTDTWFCIWETRRRDYAAYAAAKSGVDNNWKSPGFAQGESHPVVDVSWNDAHDFCEWLNDKEHREGKLAPNLRYRLPTDWEWSVAVGLNEPRWGTPQSKDQKIKGYPWGNEWPPPKGSGNYASSLDVDSFDRTSPVASFKANRYGIYDIGGNAWEWVENQWSDTSSLRVLRGASWGNVYQVNLLSSSRINYHPDNRDDIVGFRVVVASD